MWKNPFSLEINMTKKWNIISLVASSIVCGFLVIEFSEPTSSLAVLVSMIILSIIGFACSIIGVKSKQTGVSVAAFILGGLAMVSILALFLIMLVMGA